MTASEHALDTEQPSPTGLAKGAPNRTLMVLLPAITALYGVYQGVQQIVLPAHVEQINPTGKVGSLALLAAVASVMACIALPIGGTISDRTTSRFGRRTPWLVAAAVGTMVGLVGMGLSNSILGLAIFVGLAWFAANWYQGVVYAIIPDRIPEQVRGTASAVVGLALPLGILIFVNVAAKVDRMWGYCIGGIVLLITTLALVLVDRDRPLAEIREQQAARGERARNSPFLSAFKVRDFNLVFFSRIMFSAGYFAVAGYTFYIVTDYVGAANVPNGDPKGAVALIATISTVSQIVAVLIFGKLADVFNRRKLCVGLSAFVMAISLVVPLVYPTWTGMLIYSVLMGAGMGTYFAVDVAVMSLVLPNKLDEGRDLGILAIATSLMAALTPLVAAWLVTASGTYASVFYLGAAASVLGGASMLMVRSLK